MPLSDYDERSIGKTIPWLRDWVAHPTYDDYWAQISIQADVEDIDVPNVTITGWYDPFLNQALDLIPALRDSAGSELARRHQHLIVGPWGHGPGWFVGDREFGGDADYDVGDLERRWFEHFLKDQDTGIEELAPYRLFVMGSNIWRNAEEWPLPETRYVPYYFHSEGNANTLTGDGYRSEFLAVKCRTDSCMIPIIPFPLAEALSYSSRLIWVRWISRRWNNVRMCWSTPANP
jgi:putative CocE/NonD family hydrolase